MKTTIALALVCSALLTACSSGRKAETLFPPHEANLAQQKMCRDGAAKYFEEVSRGSPAGYVNHYDPDQNVCYIRRDNNVGSDVFVEDVFEGREYGRYSEKSPITCRLEIPGKTTIICKSKDEFDSLTEKYFGVAQ